MLRGGLDGIWGYQMTPEAKKRCEEMVQNVGYKNDPTGREIAKMEFRNGYQAGYNDPDRQGILEECEKALMDAKEAYEDSYDGEEITPDWYLNLDMVLDKLKAARDE